MRDCDERARLNTMIEYPSIVEEKSSREMQVFEHVLSVNASSSVDSPPIFQSQDGS